MSLDPLFDWGKALKDDGVARERRKTPPGYWAVGLKIIYLFADSGHPFHAEHVRPNLPPPPPGVKFKHLLGALFRTASAQGVITRVRQVPTHRASSHDRGGGMGLWVGVPKEERPRKGVKVKLTLR